MTEEQERRRFVRVPAEFAVLVQRVGSSAGENLAKTEVVGQGGCLFVHPEAIGLEETVELLISARGSVLKTTARVAYEKLREDGRYDIGVEFLAMSPEDRERLQQVLGSFSQPLSGD
ncbi:MAG: PilZ domain-containing protein [Thermoanaerobaculum sp.]|nr:PilZ domain-containing protein [Thermoanaerobaculum sp.]